jgi:lipopolysaccharide export system permease protein
MVVFALLYRHSEVHPILAAGVPVYRLALPIIAGTLFVNATIVANQELLIPKIAHRLQASRSEGRADREVVEQVHDYETGIMIGGKWLHLSSRQLEEARFLLPVPQVAGTLTPLKARQATYFSATPGRPAGWLLKDVSPRFSQLNLTAAGQASVLAMEDPKDVFVVSDVSFDQLSSRSRSYRFVSTPELVRRIKNPAYSIVSIRGQMQNLHFRLLRPLADVICVLLAVPLIIRKESRSLAANMAVCTVALAGIYALSQAANYLGSVNLIETDVAAWAPLIFSGSLGAWLSGIAQT